MCARYEERTSFTPGMMRGHLVRQLCVGRHGVTNKDCEEKFFHFYHFFALSLVKDSRHAWKLLVYYLSEGFKVRLEAAGLLP